MPANYIASVLVSGRPQLKRRRAARLFSHMQSHGAKSTKCPKRTACPQHRRREWKACYLPLGCLSTRRAPRLSLAGPCSIFVGKNYQQSREGGTLCECLRALGSARQQVDSGFGALEITHRNPARSDCKNLRAFSFFKHNSGSRNVIRPLHSSLVQTFLRVVMCEAHVRGSIY